MPWPIDYTGGQDEDLTRAIDVVHIEPSIREGLFLVPSLYGPGASFPIRRYPPTNLTPPYLTGDPQIPNILTCNVGKWASSPAANFAFQWMRDGVDLAGETNQTLQTTTEMDNTDITCEVRAFTYLGETYELSSNSIHASLIEPQEIHDLDFHFITGLSLQSRLSMQTSRLAVVTGMGAENAQTVVRGVLYFMTGRAADTRNDVNAEYIDVITGLHSAKRNDIMAMDACVISDATGLPLVEHEPQTMPLKNNNAELGMLGWEVFGAATYNSDIRAEGVNSWWGGQNVDAAQANIPYSYMWQDVQVFDVWVDDVDLGDCHVLLSWYQYSYAGKDQGNVRVEFLNESKTVIGSNNGPGLFATPYGGFFILRSFEALIPVNTRYVRVYAEFNLVEGKNNDSNIDYILCQIRKGTKKEGRDFGPNFSKWRLNFTQYNTGNYVTLSELEFRNISGGVDLATGGTVLVGSEGNGGLAAYAFDDLRNGNYWASSSEGVENGHAWIGYDMGIDCFPQELSITARNGSYSLFMGRDFILQGSEDGKNWIDVQMYEELAAFSSEEQRQFEVLRGTIPWWGRTAFPATTNTVGVGVANKVDYIRGNVFRARARFNLEEVQGCVPAGTNLTLGAAKVEYTFANGLMRNPQQVNVGVASVNGWMSAVLLEPIELEVGDYFLVFGVTNLNYQGGLRYWYDVQNNYSTGLYPVKDYSLVQWQHGWISTQTSAYDFGKNNVKDTLFYAVDFQGTIF